jgi:RNA polymerase sigma-70 factor (ECF subfamily)
MRHAVAFGQIKNAGSCHEPYPFGELTGIEVSVNDSSNASETLVAGTAAASQKQYSILRHFELAKHGDRQSASVLRQGEARLVDQAKRGDDRAFSELYKRHVDMIYRYTYARVGDALAAEDLTAQVFLKAFEGLPNYEPRGAPFSAWLYRIAHARTVDYWRQQQRRKEIALFETLPARDPQPEEVVVTKTEWAAALDLLAQLTDDQRDVIILRFIEEMSLAEVAETLEKTVGAVKALQHRALASLSRIQGK